MAKTISRNIEKLSGAGNQNDLKQGQIEHRGTLTYI